MSEKEAKKSGWRMLSGEEEKNKKNNTMATITNDKKQVFGKPLME